MHLHVVESGRELSSAGALDSVDLSFRARLQTADHRLRFLGPTLRGAFGFAFKDLVCQVAHRECARCTLREVCPYPAIFDGVPPSDRTIMRKYPNVPQPWLLVCAGPERWLGEPDELRFGIRLFGQAARFAPYVVEAMNEIGRRGLGPARVPFSISDVRSDDRHVWSVGDDTVAVPPPMSTAMREAPTGQIVRFRFETPVDLGEQHNGSVDGLSIVLAGRRRLFLLQSFYGVCASAPDPHLEVSAFRTLESTLRPWRIERFSGRQGRRVPLHGVIGEITIEGPWPRAGRWLNAIERIFLGKHTTFGLGRVTWQEIG